MQQLHILIPTFNINYRVIPLRYAVYQIVRGADTCFLFITIFNENIFIAKIFLQCHARTISAIQIGNINNISIYHQRLSMSALVKQYWAKIIRYKDKNQILPFALLVIHFQRLNFRKQILQFSITQECHMV